MKTSLREAGVAHSEYVHFQWSNSMKPRNPGELIFWQFPGAAVSASIWWEQTLRNWDAEHSQQLLHLVGEELRWFRSLTSGSQADILLWKRSAGAAVWRRTVRWQVRHDSRLWWSRMPYPVPQAGCDKATEQRVDLRYHLPTSVTGNPVGPGESLILSGVASTWTYRDDLVANVTPR